MGTSWNPSCVGARQLDDEDGVQVSVPEGHDWAGCGKVVLQAEVQASAFVGPHLLNFFHNPEATLDTKNLLHV